MINVIADTGFIVATIDNQDVKHQACIDLYLQADVILMPQSVLNEVCYLLRRSGSNLLVAQFLRSLSSSKFFMIPLEASDIIRTAEILEQYADSRVDFVDATVAAIAERLRITEIFTLDRRDFQIMRPRHVPYFDILPH